MYGVELGQYVNSDGRPICRKAVVEIVELGQYVNSDGRPSPAAPDGTGHTGQAGPSLVSSLNIVKSTSSSSSSPTTSSSSWTD